MAVREVIRMGHPTLRLKAAPVSKEEILSEDFKALVQDMFDTMDEQDGIGIAAPQINVSKQVAIVGLPNDEDDFDVMVVINPKLTVTNEELSGNFEGCLSVPNMTGFVERPSGVKVEYASR